MTESTRTSALASRHRALGSDLEDWNGMGTAWSYHTNPDDEHDAVRECAGLFDMSPLKKIRIKGSDSSRVLNHLLTRDVYKINPGRSAYSSVLTKNGTMSDDAIVANCGNDEYLVVHGSGGTFELLEDSALGSNISFLLDDDLHDISLQGPAALNLLNQFCSEDLSQLGYFDHITTRLFDKQCRISRTGYSGERGYEIFVDSNAVTDIWDNILQEGQSSGVMPCSFTALDKVRIEAALLFYGYDMTEDNTPWELGLGFTIDQSKDDFRGKEALMASKNNPKIINVGISVEHDDMLTGEEVIFHQGTAVGLVNSPAFSHRINKSLALAHVTPDASEVGIELEIVGGDGTRYRAQVSSIPFVDPLKTKTHSL